jgi:hypothetical protein
VSFASKLVHVFANVDRFAIYDSVAARVLRTHVDARLPESPSYVEWYAAWHRLHTGIGFTCTPRHLDRYLWMRGLIAEWRRKGSHAEINAEVRRPGARRSRGRCSGDRGFRGRGPTRMTSIHRSVDEHRAFESSGDDTAASTTLGSARSSGDR